MCRPLNKYVKGDALTVRTLRERYAAFGVVL